ncbi:uncharacterized protein LOC115724896 isoform X4 [Cannabis sativa]|uniref:uncharacterized protein LOC115724896 isoform X4 n=1 Tax=Cannabis sativa TaxID=3483 RepID=UPI0029CA57AD|nr:uncharacterized protein LOC115724896 isoform X4 [Cannabis sativa]
MILFLIFFLEYIFQVAMAEDISIFCLMQTKVALCNHSNSINHLISDTSGTKKRAIPVKVDAPKPKRAKISKSERNILILRKKCMLRDKSLNLNRRNGITFMIRRISSLRKPFRLLHS